MLSGKLPTGTVGTGDDTDRTRRRTHGTVPQRSDGPPRSTDRSGRVERRPNRTDATRANTTTAAPGAASTATTETGTTTTAPTASGTTTADGTRTVTPPAAASAEPHATPTPTGGRKRNAESAASDEKSRLRRRLSDERAERQAVIDHYERLLTERTMAAADCEGESGAGTGRGRGTGTDPGSARAWLRRAISRLRIAWSRRG